MAVISNIIEESENVRKPIQNILPVSPSLRFWSSQVLHTWLWKVILVSTFFPLGTIRSLFGTIRSLFDTIRSLFGTILSLFGIIWYYLVSIWFDFVTIWHYLQIILHYLGTKWHYLEEVLTNSGFHDHVCNIIILQLLI